jgi:hypothetical protein
MGSRTPVVTAPVLTCAAAVMKECPVAAVSRIVHKMPQSGLCIDINDRM